MAILGYRSDFEPEIIILIIFLNRLMKTRTIVDSGPCWQLVATVVGIYVCYLLCGILLEMMTHTLYLNHVDKTYDAFTWPSGILIFACGIGWMISTALQTLRVSQKERIKIPLTKCMGCVAACAFSMLIYFHVVVSINFHVATMYRTGKVMAVSLVSTVMALLKCRLIINIKGWILGVIITCSIVAFAFHDTQVQFKEEKRTLFINIALMVFSMVAQGFFSYFQAGIMPLYKYQPLSLMEVVNKWVCLLAVLYATCRLQIGDSFYFMTSHRLFVWHLLLFSLLSCIGQLLVYRLVSTSKSYVSQFIINIRHLLSVILSLYIFHHEVNHLQYVAMTIIFLATTFLFLSEMFKNSQENRLTDSFDMKTSISDSVDNEKIEPQAFSLLSLSPKKEMGAEIIESQNEINTKQRQIYEARLGTRKNSFTNSSVPDQQIL